QRSGKNMKLLAQSVEEVPNQISIVRENRDKNALGSVFFRSSFLQNNPQGFTDYLKENTYQYPAAPPVMEWIEEKAPLAPENLSVSISEASGNYLMSWYRSTANSHEFKRYMVYQVSSEGEMPEAGAVRALVSAEEFAIPPDVIQ